MRRRFQFSVHRGAAVWLSADTPRQYPPDSQPAPAQDGSNSRLDPVLSEVVECQSDARSSERRKSAYSRTIRGQASCLARRNDRTTRHPSGMKVVLLAGGSDLCRWWILSSSMSRYRRSLNARAMKARTVMFGRNAGPTATGDIWLDRDARSPSAPHDPSRPGGCHLHPSIHATNAALDIFLTGPYDCR
jgi:hypothetical protein